jgi:hypothetical protein
VFFFFFERERESEKKKSQFNSQKKLFSYYQSVSLSVCSQVETEPSSCLLAYKLPHSLSLKKQERERERASLPDTEAKKKGSLTRSAAAPYTNPKHQNGLTTNAINKMASASSPSSISPKKIN